MNFVTNIIGWIQHIFMWWVIINPWERGLRVRRGKDVTLLTEGVYLKIPVIDSVYVQTIRLRAIGLPVQTITTKDGKTISIVVSASYSISDIKKLYYTLYRPEMTIANIVMGAIAEYVAGNDYGDCLPSSIERSVNAILIKNEYGLGDMAIKVIGYAVVKTYRLIQDGHYMDQGITLDQTTNKPMMS